MLEDLPAADEITKHVDRLLRQADAYGRYPTPVDTSSKARIIHVSPTVDYAGKQRFVVLHETSHGIISHQRDLLYADDNEKLSPATNLMFEREANRATAELPFQRNNFMKVAAQFETSLDTVRYLAQHYGSSFHAALRAA
jgi:hypothetical protein